MSILDALNSEQRAAASTIEGPVMVFAGAGTGKTRTLTARIAYMIDECKIKPWYILAITFTKKATNEMKDRLYSLLDQEANGIQISTIHSLCAKILRRDIDKIGYKKNFEILDEDDVQKVLTEIYKDKDLDKKMFSTRAASKYISDRKNGLELYNQTGQEIYDAYTKYCFDNGYLDFDDLLVKVSELFDKVPEVLARYQNLYKYVLVDEFQDTNKIQYKIIRQISAIHNNLFVVGDDDQSIYSFRGACIDNILGFTKDYPDAKVFKLLQNYRSHNSILKGANAVIRNNTNRVDKKLYSTTEGKVTDVVIQQALYYEEEIRFVCNEISHLVTQKGLKYSDIAVLYRNSALSRNFEMAFIDERIPYNIYGGFSYLKRREVKDIISYLRYIVDPTRLAHFKRIINLPPRGIGEKTINHVTTVMAENSCDIFDAIDLIYKENQSSKNKVLYEFKKMITELREEIEKTKLVDFFDLLLERTGYLEYLEKEDPLGESNRVDNLREFKSLLFKMEDITSETGEEITQKEKLRIGIDEILLEQTYDDDRTENAVTLSTIHSVKGLEFEAVFVVALEEGIFPSIREEADIEEERRVAYVAFTRAKSKIYLSCAQKRLIYGRVVQNRISRFLNEYLQAESVQEACAIQKAEDAKEGELCIGAKVNHKYFGYGKVIAIDDDFLQIVFEKDDSIKKIKRDYPYIKVLE